LIDFITGFFFGLTFNAVFRIILLKQTCTGFNQQTIRITVDISRHPKLTCQDHCAFGFVVQQNSSAIATVIGFTVLQLPLPMLV